MIKKSAIIMILVIMLISAFGIDYTPAYAYAYNTNFVSKIHYQNVGTGIASVSIKFYDANGDEKGTYSVTSLAPNAVTTLFAGSVSGLTSGFKGSAVIESNQPLASVIAQVDPSGAVKNQPLSSGFSEGSGSVLIPTVLKKMFYFTSVFVVQNVDSTPADFKITFVPVTGSMIVHNVTNVPPYASRLFDMGTLSAITTSTFNGAVFIESFRTGTTTPGSIVGTSMELENAGNNAYAFDGASATSNKIYMPTAVCKFGPNKDSTSAYAVQNNNSTSVQVTVTYSNGKIDGPHTLPAYGKRSFDGCSAGNPIGFLGSAIVNASANIQAVGKVYGGGLYPAHLAFITGYNQVSLPFMRWTETKWLNGVGQRTYIAIQNIGTSSIPAGQVTIKYYDKNGVLKGTHTLGAIAVGAKANSHPQYIGAAGSEFGTYPDGSEGGGAIVTGPTGSQLAVVVRVQKYIGAGRSAGEDYTGIPIK